MKKTKCILLYSGGLDSLLAARILLNEGLDVTGLHFILPYYPPDTDPETFQESIFAARIGLKLIHYRCGDEYLDILKNPGHGYGKNVNPCIDCKIFFIQKAAELMTETGADFVATGEVVGQRPMSQQRHTLNHIENSTLKGRLLRPLSAKLLKPTIPELDGLINRDHLYDISGRGRTRQIELARSFGIEDYSSPGGGCLFTDKYMAARIIDLIMYKPDFTVDDLYLIKTGRHFRISQSLKIIVSKNEQDTKNLEKYIKNSDFFLIPDFSGPSVYVSGFPDDVEFHLINSIITRYGKPTADNNLVDIYEKGMRIKQVKAVDAIDDKDLEQYRI